MATRETLDPSAFVESIVSEAHRHSATAPTHAAHEHDHDPEAVVTGHPAPPARRPNPNHNKES